LSLIAGRVQRACETRELVLVIVVCLVTVLFQPAVSHAQGSVVLVGSGSTVPAPLYAEFSEAYNKRGPKFQMRYLPMSTAEGITQISRGSGDFAAGEVPLSAKDHSAKLIELPSALIAIVPIYNLPGVKKQLRFSGEVLAEIFLGQIKSWNAPALVKLNPDAALPDTPIRVVYRPGGKGSNYIFTDFLSKTSSRFRAEIGPQASPKWPIGSPAERSQDMADKVKSESASIGYVELQYAAKAGLSYGSVSNPAGHYVEASSESITAACIAVEAPGWDKFAASLTNAPGANAFPITSFTWLYVRTDVSGERSHALADLLRWIYSEGQELATQSGYTQLPPSLLARVKQKAAGLH